jgi:hypothetical protein
MCAMGGGNGRASDLMLDPRRLGALSPVRREAAQDRAVNRPKAWPNAWCLKSELSVVDRKVHVRLALRTAYPGS